MTVAVSTTGTPGMTVYRTLEYESTCQVCQPSMPSMSSMSAKYRQYSQVLSNCHPADLCQRTVSTIVISTCQCVREENTANEEMDEHGMSAARISLILTTLM